ncbi:hypothetical protein D3C80_1075320 [compost metagenome]
MVNARFVNVFNSHRQTTPRGGHTGDTAAHQAATQNADTVQFMRLCIATAFFLQGGRGKEQAAQRGGLRGHGQFAKRPRLGFITAGAAVIQTGTHHLNNAFCGRIIAVRFLQRFLAHNAEQQAFT